MKSGFRQLLNLVLVAATSALAQTPANTHWVGTWATASYANHDVVPHGATSPAGVPDLGPLASNDETVREVVHTSIGGSTVRVEVSNTHGTSPLKVGAASLGISAGHGSVRGDSMRALQFGGNPGITVPAGGSALSDPVNLKFEPLTDLAISLFLPAQAIPTVTAHPNGVAVNYRVAGNAVAQTELSGAVPFGVYTFLGNVQVLASTSAGAIVAFGDSITDGAYVTPDSNMRWPDELSRRLQADKRTRNLAVLNEGIGGNRILHDGAGPNALARLGHDALAQPGVRYIVLLEAINDIGVAYSPKNPHDVVTAEDLIAGYRQVIEQAHEVGVKVIGATLTPYMGAGYASPEGERVRVAVNDWVRTSHQFDGVIDFDAATRDPANPTMFAPTVDHGDHLHPRDAGYKIMGDAVDLGLFTK